MIGPCVRKYSTDCGCSAAKDIAYSNRTATRDLGTVAYVAYSYFSAAAAALACP